MNKTDISKKQSILKCAAVLLFALLTLWISGLLSDLTRTKAEELPLTPLIADSNGWEFYTIINGVPKELSSEEAFELETGRVFYLSRVLTKEQEDAGYTFLRLEITRPCAVFIDGELSYTNCPGDDMRMDNVSFPQDYTVTDFAPGESVRCTLPPHYAGKRLTIATAHMDPDHGTPGVILSSYAAGSDPLITGTSRELMPAGGFAMLTILLSGIWLFALFQGIRDYPSLLLILTALIRMLSHLRQFTFMSPISYTVDSPLAAFIPSVEIMLPCIWLLLQMKDRKNRLLFSAILGISAAVSLISPTAGLFGGLPFHSSFLESRTILLFPLAALLFFAVRETVREKNLIFIFLLSGLCITVCLIAALYGGSLCGEGYYADQIAYIFGDLTGSLFFYWWAVILFALSTVLALYQIIRRIAAIRTDLALQTERAGQLDERLAAQKDFYESRLAHEDAIRSLRHDMAGHLNTLAMLLDDGKPAEAKKYLDGITKYHKEQASELFSNNPYMNAVLQNYAAKCREHQIELICHIGIGDLELPATEVCLILNNALENAVDGSLTMAEGEKIIKVQATMNRNLLLLRVSNRFDGQLTVADGLPVSTKEGGGHGYGLSNIRQAAERRGGSMEYRVQNGYFILDVAFWVD